MNFDTQEMTVQELHSVNPGEFLIFMNCGRLRISKVVNHEEDFTRLKNIYVEGFLDASECLRVLNHNKKVVHSCEFVGKSSKHLEPEEVYEQFAEFFI